MTHKKYKKNGKCTKKHWIISNTAIKAQLFWLWMWILWKVWKNIPTTNKQDWRNFFDQKCEKFWKCNCIYHKMEFSLLPSPGIVGFSCMYNFEQLESAGSELERQLLKISWSQSWRGRGCYHNIIPFPKKHFSECGNFEGQKFDTYGRLKGELGVFRHF